MRLTHGTGGELGGFVASYFTDRMRHLPELFDICDCVSRVLEKKESYCSRITVQLVQR